MSRPVPGDIVPFLRYRDPRAALQWLETALGFAPLFIAEDGQGGVAHAELALGTSAIMLGGAKDDVLGMRTPAQAGGVTQGVYVVVPDADAAWARVQAAGAEVVMALYDTPYDSREFTVRDPEGHLWSVGTYRAGSYQG